MSLGNFNAPWLEALNLVAYQCILSVHVASFSCHIAYKIAQYITIKLAYFFLHFFSSFCNQIFNSIAFNFAHTSITFFHNHLALLAHFHATFNLENVPFQAYHHIT